MHSTSARFSVLCSYFSTTLAILALALIFSTIFNDINASSVKDLQVNCEVASKTMSDLDLEEPFINMREDKAKLRCSFTADFRGLFNWNMKQLFVYLAVEYNYVDKFYQAVIWDHIIERGDYPVLQASDIPPKYYLDREIKQLRDASNATISLRWYTIPYVGIFRERHFQGTIVQIQIPWNSNINQWKHVDVDTVSS